MKHHRVVEGRRALLAIVCCLLVVATGCGGGDGGGEASSPYAGTYIGTYSGDDEGTFSVVVDTAGRIVGSGRSVDLTNFSISGSVEGDGRLQFVAGNSSTGATFSGTISGNSVSGAWTLNSTGGSGTFSGGKIVPTSTRTPPPTSTGVQSPTVPPSVTSAPRSPSPSPSVTSTPVGGPSPRVVLFREGWERAGFGVYRPNGDDSPIINGDTGGWQVGDTATSVDPDEPENQPCLNRSVNSVEIRPGATGKEAVFRAVNAECGGNVFIGPTRVLSLPFSNDLQISFRETGSLAAVSRCNAVVLNIEFDGQFTLSYVLQRGPSWSDSTCDGLFTPFPLSLALRTDGLYVRQLVPDLIAAGLYDPDDPDDSLPSRVSYVAIIVDDESTAIFDEILLFRP